MEPLRSEEEIARYEDRAGLVAVYLDNGYDPEITRLMSEVRKGFDNHVESAWHLLMPVIEPDEQKPDDGRPRYMPDQFMGRYEYDIQLAKKIANSQQIAFDQLPALVFQFVKDEENGYYTAVLKGMNKARVREILIQIGKIAVAEFNRNPGDVIECRAAIHRSLVPYLNREKLLHYSKGAAAAILAIITAAAAAKTIHG